MDCDQSNNHVHVELANGMKMSGKDNAMHVFPGLYFIETSSSAYALSAYGDNSFILMLSIYVLPFHVRQAISHHDTGLARNRNEMKGVMALL
jgi:hypothetical protein